MLSYSRTTMMCFLTKEWYVFPAYTVNLFIKIYHRITCKEDLKIAQKRSVLEMICFSWWFWLWCAFYNRALKKHIILLSKWFLVHHCFECMNIEYSYMYLQCVVCIYIISIYHHHWFYITWDTQKQSVQKSWNFSSFFFSVPNSQ